MWSADNEKDMAEAVSALQAGKLVAFPTETVYGLGADGLNATACRAVYEAKGRPSDNPLILHIAGLDMLDPLVQALPEAAVQLAERFWPGPLTLVLARKEVVPDVVTGGLETVAVRWPAHPVAEGLIRAVGRPLAAPSANSSGRPSPTTAAHVAFDLGERIAGIIDGGPCAVGLESTIVDCTVAPPVILRPGGISREALEDCIGPVRLAGAAADDAAPRAPGMKYRHYAPSVPVWRLAEAQLEQVLKPLLQAPTEPVGLLLSDESIGRLGPFPPAMVVWNLGSKTHPERAAQRLYDGLRRLEAAGCHYMIVEEWPQTGIGLALMNRICKLAQPWEGERF